MGKEGGGELRGDYSINRNRSLLALNTQGWEARWPLSILFCPRPRKNRLLVFDGLCVMLWFTILGMSWFMLTSWDCL